MITKYKNLTEKYENNIKNFINKESFDESLLFNGILDFKKYLFGYFNILLNGLTSNQNNVEKVIRAILYRYGLYLGSKDMVKEEMFISIDKITEDAFYYAIGIEKYKGRNFKYDGSHGFINHLKMNVFNILLLEELRKVEHFLNSDSRYIYETDNSKKIFQELDTLKAPHSVKSKIFKYLNGDINIKKLNEIDMVYIKKISENIL